MNYKQSCSALIIFLLLSAYTQSAPLLNTEEPQAKADVDGSFTINGEVVKLNYAYAHKIKSAALLFPFCEIYTEGYDFTPRWKAILLPPYSAPSKRR
jgi:hypothetical protein